MGKMFNTTSAFDKGFRKLSLAVKDEAFELITELRDWPNLPPGRNLEKLYDHQDGPVYSLRVNYSIRMIIQVLQNNSIRLRAIGSHDDVY